MSKFLPDDAKYEGFFDHMIYHCFRYVSANLKTRELCMRILEHEYDYVKPYLGEKSERKLLSLFFMPKDILTVDFFVECFRKRVDMKNYIYLESDEYNASLAIIDEV